MALAYRFIQAILIHTTLQRSVLVFYAQWILRNCFSLPFCLIGNTFNNRNLLNMLNIHLLFFQMEELLCVLENIRRCAKLRCLIPFVFIDSGTWDNQWKSLVNNIIQDGIALIFSKSDRFNDSLQCYYCGGIWFEVRSNWIFFRNYIESMWTAVLF